MCELAREMNTAYNAAVNDYDNDCKKKLADVNQRSRLNARLCAFFHQQGVPIRSRVFSCCCQVEPLIDKLNGEER